MSDHRFTAIGPIGAQSAPFLGSRGYFYPTVIDAATIIKWYWRVRTWTLSSGLSATAGGNTAEFDNGNIGGTTAAVEKTLAWPGATCDANFGFTPSTGTSGGGTFFMMQGAAAPNYILYATDPPDGYLPWLNIAGSLSADDSDIHTPPDNSAVLVFNSNLQVFIDGSITPDGSFNAMVDGEAVPVYWKETLVGDGATSVGGLDIDPLSFWPYAAANNTPIYNTTTGAQLQSPLN